VTRHAAELVCDADAQAAVRTSPTALNVAVVGAGIGGLAAAIRLRQAGHRVTILEQTSRLLPVGAGIQLAPNATRILHSLGVLDALAPRAVAAQVSVRRRWQDGRMLGEFPLGKAVVDRFGSAYVHAHRGDLHGALTATAVDAGRPGQPVSIQLGSAVAGVDQPARGPAVLTTSDGRRVAADAVIGADGIHSRVREVIGSPDVVRFSGDVAYRSLVPVESVLKQPSLAALTERPALTIWLGPGRHLVHYLVSGGEYLNVVLCAPGDDKATESWSAFGDVADMVQALDGWDERAVRIASSAARVHTWGLYDREPLEDWTAGRVALLGDACHPMLPYQAQGAAQALEDAAALGDVLEGIDTDAVAEALSSYSARRQPRAAAVQLASRHNRELFHLPDGPGQALRDEQLGEMSGDFDSYAWIWSSSAPSEAGRSERQESRGTERRGARR